MGFFFESLYSWNDPRSGTVFLFFMLVDFFELAFNNFNVFPAFSVWQNYIRQMAKWQNTYKICRAWPLVTQPNIQRFQWLPSCCIRHLGPSSHLPRGPWFWPSTQGRQCWGYRKSILLVGPYLWDTPQESTRWRQDPSWIVAKDFSPITRHRMELRWTWRLLFWVAVSYSPRPTS